MCSSSKPVLLCIVVCSFVLSPHSPCVGGGTYQILIICMYTTCNPSTTRLCHCLITTWWRLSCHSPPSVLLDHVWCFLRASYNLFSREPCSVFSVPCCSGADSGNSRLLSTAYYTQAFVSVLFPSICFHCGIQQCIPMYPTYIYWVLPEENYVTTNRHGDSRRWWCVVAVACWSFLRLFGKEGSEGCEGAEWLAWLFLMERQAFVWLGVGLQSACLLLELYSCLYILYILCLSAVAFPCQALEETFRNSEWRKGGRGRLEGRQTTGYYSMPLLWRWWWAWEPILCLWHYCGQAKYGHYYPPQYVSLLSRLDSSLCFSLMPSASQDLPF